MDEFFTLPVDINEVKTITNLVDNMLVDLNNSLDQIDMEGDSSRLNQMQYTELASKIETMSTAKAGLDMLVSTKPNPTAADLAMALCGPSETVPDLFGAGLLVWKQCTERAAAKYEMMLYYAQEREYAKEQAISAKHREAALKKSLQLYDRYLKENTAPPPPSDGGGSSGGGEAQPPAPPPPPEGEGVQPSPPRGRGRVVVINPIPTE